VAVDGSLRMEYNDTEVSQLKVVHVEVPSVPNFMDISMVDQTVCDTGLTLLADDVVETEETEIKKGMMFDTLEHLKYFLMDYAVRFHMPYYVTHCDKNKRYTVLQAWMWLGSMCSEAEKREMEDSKCQATSLLSIFKAEGCACPKHSLVSWSSRCWRC
jgi:hypothetical protein